MDRQVFKLFSCTLYRKLFWKGFVLFFLLYRYLILDFCRTEPKGEIKDKNISKYFVNICVRLQKYYITVLIYISKKHFTVV